MNHLATALFFITIFIGAGVGLHLMVRKYWEEMLAALRVQAPVRRVDPARCTVTYLPGLASAYVRQRRGAAF